jgi:uncharacterized C2H2 Zn-finger protein
MTDHYAVVNAEELRPVPKPQPPFACEQCGRLFDTTGALAVHKRSHEEKQPCPECGALYFRGPGMSRHRQTAHGVAKANGQAAKVGGRPVKSGATQQERKICPECHKAIRADNLRRHRRDVHGYVEAALFPVAPVTPREQVVEEPDLTEDDLFTAAIGMLFPNGVIPVAKVQALFAWRDATRRMLEEVSGG